MLTPASRERQPPTTTQNGMTTATSDDTHHPQTITHIPPTPTSHDKCLPSLPRTTTAHHDPKRAQPPTKTTTAHHQDPQMRTGVRKHQHQPHSHHAQPTTATTTVHAHRRVRVIVAHNARNPINNENDYEDRLSAHQRERRPGPTTTTHERQRGLITPSSLPLTPT